MRHFATFQNYVLSAENGVFKKKNQRACHHLVKWQIITHLTLYFIVGRRDISARLTSFFLEKSDEKNRTCFSLAGEKTAAPGDGQATKSRAEKYDKLHYKGPDWSRINTVCWHIWDFQWAPLELAALVS